MKRGQVIWFGRLRCEFLKVRKSDKKLVVVLKSGAKMIAPAEMFNNECKSPLI